MIDSFDDRLVGRQSEVMDSSEAVHKPALHVGRLVHRGHETVTDTFVYMSFQWANVGIIIDLLRQIREEVRVASRVQNGGPAAKGSVHYAYRRKTACLKLLVRLLKQRTEYRFRFADSKGCVR